MHVMQIRDDLLANFILKFGKFLGKVWFLKCLLCSSFQDSGRDFVRRINLEKFENQRYTFLFFFISCKKHNYIFIFAN